MTVSLSLAKQHLEYEDDDRDALITQYLAAAVAWVENYTGKKLSRGTVTQEIEAFDSYVQLQWGPSPASVSAAYIDENGDAQTMTDARLVRDRLYPPLAGWPTLDDYTPVTLSYTAGYTSSVADLDSAVLLLVGEYFANREAGSAKPSVVEAVECICRPYRPVLV